MERFIRMLRQSPGEVSLDRRNCFIEGPPLLIALRSVRPVKDVRSSLKAKMRLMMDLRRLTFEGPYRF